MKDTYSTRMRNSSAAIPTDQRRVPFQLSPVIILVEEPSLQGFESGPYRHPVNVKVNTESCSLGEGVADFCFYLRRERRAAEVEESTVMLPKLNS